MCEEEDASHHAEADGGTTARTLTLHASQDAMTGGIGSARTRPCREPAGAASGVVAGTVAQEAGGIAGPAVGGAVSGRCFTESVQR